MGSNQTLAHSVTLPNKRLWIIFMQFKKATTDCSSIDFAIVNNVGNLPKNSSYFF